MFAEALRRLWGVVGTFTSPQDVYTQNKNIACTFGKVHKSPHNSPHYSPI